MTIGYLDRVWRSQGAAGVRAAFRSIARRSREDAIRALNDEENGFPVTYILAQEVEKLGLEAELPSRALYGLWLVAAKAQDAERAARYAALLGVHGKVSPPEDALKWVILTGAGWDGPHAGRDDYDAALDLAAAYYAASFNDAQTLTRLAELVFYRNRRGLFVHDLVWGLLQGADASALSVVAKYIVSDNASDSDLACKLLGLKTPRNASDKVKTYAKFTEWLAENRPFIYLTGEHFNAMSVPHHLELDEEAKYLKREIHPRTREPFTPLTEEELSALAVFRLSRSGGSERTEV